NPESESWAPSVGSWSSSSQRLQPSGRRPMNATDRPKAPPIAPPGEGTIAARVAAGLGLRPSPLDDRHFGRLAIVYVRQSDPQQVLNHIESRERQYARSRSRPDIGALTRVK